MLKVASNPIDVQDFQFKLQCRLKIFDNAEGNPIKNASNLIASASRFGLLFAGCNSPQLKVIRFASIEDYSSSNPIVNYSRREVILPSVPQHINVNCDHTVLSVIVERDNCPVVLFYDVKSFLSQNIVTLNEIRLSTTQGVKILSASWHPTVASIFTDCKTDGTLGVYELKGKAVDIKKLPAESRATCFCWSPKGKQIAVGSKDGKLTHYKPDLKAVKVINAPPFENPNTMISVQWISTFQFIGIFKPLDDSEDQCSIVSIDAPKTGNPVFTNFYDICYSNGSFRSPQFYMIFEQHWNILIVASSNSMEVGVLALAGDSWVQWTLTDSARAELPLDENREETYPVGIAIDSSSVKPVPWGESSLQPAPSLLLLSHQGVLCCFKIINLKEGAPGINSPPENLSDLSGSGAFTTGGVTVSKTISDNSNVHQSAQPPLMQNIPQQSKQIQKEPNPIQSTFKINPITQIDNKSMQTPQINFQTQLSEAQPTQKASLSNESQAVNNFAVTNLFGGQVTITPTNNKGPTSKIVPTAKGSMFQTNMNAGIPISVVSDVASSSTLITPKQSNQQIITTNAGAPQTQQKIAVPASVAQVLPENVPSSVVNQSETQQENSEEIEKILAEMIQMECSALEKELKIILFQGKNIRINLDPQSMDTIVNQTKDIDDFIVELIGTSESQSSEIHILKQNTVQSWAWLEEAKSRLREYQNEELSALLKSKPLDSVSEKHLHTLKQMEYYLDSQLSQAHKALDEQWDKFQEYCRKINRVQLPTMEAIFQTMVKQNAILQKHDFILKDITSQIKGKKRIGEHVSLFNNLSKNESLEDSFHKLKLEPEDIYQIYYKKIMNRVKPMPQNKSKQLRRILQNREVPHVKVNSQVAKSVLQRTPERKDTSIFVHMTPTAKQREVLAKTINFYQSTPLNIESNHPATQIPSSNLSAFAATNIGKSSSASIPSSGIKTGKENMYNVKPDTFPNAAFIKSPEIEACTPSASNIPFNIIPKTTINNESKSISNGQAGSSNVGQSASASTSLLGFMLKSKATISQSDQKLLFTTTKSTSSAVNVNEKLENPVSSGLSKTTSNIKIDQNSSSYSTPQSIFSSKLVPSISTQSNTSSPVSSNLAKSTVSFGKPLNSGSLFTVKTTEKSTEQSISSTSSNPNSSFSFITVSTATSTKPSFFTPITSGHLNTPSTNASQQLPIVNPSSSKTSAFTPLISPQLPINNSSVPPSTSITTSSSIFGKSSTVSSNMLSTSSASSQPSSFSVTPQNVASTEFKSTTTLNEPASSGISSVFGNTFTTVNQSETISSSSTSTSSGFSFLTGIQSTISSTTSPLQSHDQNTQVPITTQSLFSNSLSTSGSGAGIFGTTTTTATQISGSNLFGPTNTTTVQQLGPVSSSSNIFGNTTSPQIFSSMENSTSSIFASVATTSSGMLDPKITIAPQIFGSNVTTGSSIFSPPTTTTPIIGSTGSSIFGTTTSSIFSTSVSSSRSGGSTFGANTTFAPSSTSSLFSGTSGSVFGSSASGVTSANSGSLFDSTPVSNNKSIFNTVATGNQQTFGSSIFGQATSPFNVSTTTSTPAFGESISFGAPSTSASPSFGASTFVGNDVPTFGVVSSSAPMFGSVKTSSSSLFGNVTSAAPSPFGIGTLTSSATSFDATSSSTNSPFGKPSVFGQSSAFSSGGFNTTQTTSTSIFGQSKPGTSSAFGNSATSNTFGGTTTSSTFGTSATPFGTTPSAGGTSLFEQTNSSLFGSPKNIFGGSANTENVSGSFGFGSLNVGAAIQNPEQTVTKSPFGGGNFSDASTTGSIFGSSTFGSTSGGSIFGQPTFGNSSNFGSNPQQPAGPFSGGSGSVSQTGFGTAPAFQKPAGFGVQPSFGGSPTFGAVPTFGGSPTFGSTSPFGSPNKVFGSASPTGVFGTANQPSSGFGNLANQNTIGFGSLAQSASNPGQNASFSGSSSFSSWR